MFRKFTSEVRWMIGMLAWHWAILQGLRGAKKEAKRKLN